MDRRRALGVLLVIVSACGFGSGALFAKPVYALGVGWLTLLAWRFAIGAGLAWAWLLLVHGRDDRVGRLSRRSSIVAVALGLLYVGNSGTYYAGLETVSASLAALIVYIYPALVAVLSLRFGRRLEGGRAWLALVLAMAGVALAVGGIDPGGAAPIAGLLLIVASPVIYSVWIILAARLSGERRGVAGAQMNPEPPVARMSGADAAATVALMMTATAIVYWLAALGTGTAVTPDRIPAGAWIWLVAVGVVATFVAIQTFYAGAGRIGAAEAALVSTIEPPYTVVLAALLLHEQLRPIQLAGGALIIAGVLIAQTAPNGPPAQDIRLADE
jgi:drug/metabolite transporter (DMT)-like permease